MNDEQLKIVLTAVNNTKPVFDKMKTDMKGVSGKINTLQKTTATASKKIKDSFKNMGTQAKIALAAIGYAVFRIAKGMVNAASDLEETQSKFNVVFDDIVGEANTWAEEFGRAMGRSEESMKAFTATTGDMLKPLGFATAEAFSLSKAMTTLALDVASFTNRQDADVIRAFQAAITGERESLKTLGIVINEADVKQEAFRIGLYNGTGEVHKQAKALATINLLYANTEDAQGDLARTSDSFANKMKFLTAKMEDFQAEMGNKIIPSLLVFANIVMPTVQSIMDSFSSKTKEASAETGSFAKIIVVLVETFRAGFMFIKTIIKNVGRVIGTMVATAVDKLGTLGRVVKAVFTGDFKEAVYQYEQYQKRQEAGTKDATEKMGQDWRNLGEQIEGSLNRITDAYDAQAQEEKNASQGGEMLKFAKENAERIKSEIQTMIDGFKGAFDNVESGSEEAAKALEKVDDAVQKIRDSFSDLKGDLKDIGTKTAESMAEAVVQQEEKIKEIRSQLKGEDDQERINALNAELKKEEEALKQFGVVSAGLQKEISEQRRQNELTDFERRIEELDAQKQAEVAKINEKAEALQAQLDAQLEASAEMRGSDKETADSTEDMVDTISKGYRNLETRVGDSVEVVIEKNKQLMAELAKFRALTAPTEGPDRRTFEDIVAQAGAPDPATGGILTPPNSDFNAQYPGRALSRIQDNVREAGGGSTLTVNFNNPVVDTPAREASLVERLKIGLGRDFAKSNLASG